MTADWCSLENAHNLARKIRVYWAQRGFDNVHTEVYAAGKASPTRGQTVYAVRSNMKDGYPPMYGRK